MIAALLAVPFVAGLCAFLIRHDRSRRVLLVSAAFVHCALTARAWFARPEAILWGWLALDDVALLFLTITSVLFSAAAVYCLGYLDDEKKHRTVRDSQEGFLITNSPEAVFTGCLLLFLASMTMAIAGRHFGIIWVAMEATTLSSAPLIYFHRHHRSLEATWKYLLICSVGIALALLGNLFLAVSGGGATLVLDELIARPHIFNSAWLKAAFIFLFIGYGTKMGLAPLHTWLPDAHSEAPSVISALLSGALLNCAFVAIIRSYQVCLAAGLFQFCRDIFVLFGIISLFFAAIFITGQRDYKRMLAYSSIEHMGILSLGLGLGKGAVWGAMFHALNHSLTKAALFFAAGTILSVYRSKSVQVRGVGRTLPVTGALWIAGFFSITGFPPFATFMSKLIILKASIDQGHYAIAGLFLLSLAAIFVALVRIFIPMVQPRPDGVCCVPKVKESFFSLAPSIILIACVCCAGLYVPPRLHALLDRITAMMGGM